MKTTRLYGPPCHWHQTPPSHYGQLLWRPRHGSSPAATLPPPGVHHRSPTAVLAIWKVL
ncbi:hypothetical protein L210DRAFT_3550048, partial [Boletus edulis BED1]